MRNRALHDALRDFALEAAALLTEDVKAGAEIEFDVIDDGARRGRSGPALYRYEPRTRSFVAERWHRLRELPSCARAADELGAGAAAWLRVNGLRGEQAEPALQAMLDRLYEDSTSFGFPEERFERVYREVELTLYRGAVRARLVAPLLGASIDADRVDLGDGLSLARGDRMEAPPEAVWPEGGDGGPAVLCLLERDLEGGTQLSVAEAEARFLRLVTAMRLWAAGAVGLGGPGWRRADEGRWTPVPLGASRAGRGDGWFLAAGEETPFREFLEILEESPPAGVIAWSLDRFEMGCERPRAAEALSDYLLALRALLDATSDAGEASLALRVAALCAEEGRRRTVQRRIEAAVALERFVMGGVGRPPAESPGDLVAEVEQHVRALLRDVLCGYLDPNLKALADDILLETLPDPMGEIEARDLRRERAAEAGDGERVAEEDAEHEAEPLEQEAGPREHEARPLEQKVGPLEHEAGPVEHQADVLEHEADTSEMEPVATPQPASQAPPPVQEPARPAPVQQPARPAPEPQRIEGVTPSADWGWGEPEDYSAPV
jgi:hypothetical protein